jgi:hypothetical protein
MMMVNQLALLGSPVTAVMSRASNPAPPIANPWAANVNPAACQTVFVSLSSWVQWVLETYKHHEVCLEMSEGGLAVERFVGLDAINSHVVRVYSKVGIWFLHGKEDWLSAAVPKIIEVDPIYVAYGLMPRTAGGHFEKVQGCVTRPISPITCGEKITPGYRV